MDLLKTKMSILNNSKTSSFLFKSVKGYYLDRPVGYGVIDSEEYRTYEFYVKLAQRNKTQLPVYFFSYLPLNKKYHLLNGYLCKSFVFKADSNSKLLLTIQSHLDNLEKTILHLIKLDDKISKLKLPHIIRRQKIYRIFGFFLVLGIVSLGLFLAYMNFTKHP